MLKLADLKKQGLQLSQIEAQEVHSRINGIAQGHHQNGLVYSSSTETPQSDPLKAYYTELREKNAELVKRIAELEDASNRTVGNYEYQMKIEELEKENESLKSLASLGAVHIPKQPFNISDFHNSNTKSDKVIIMEYNPDEQGENPNGQANNDDYTIDDSKKVDGETDINKEITKERGKPGRKPKAN